MTRAKVDAAYSLPGSALRHTRGVRRSHRHAGPETRMVDPQKQLGLNLRNATKLPSSKFPGTGGGGRRVQHRASSERNRDAQNGHPGGFRTPVDKSRSTTIVK